jgi:hypothetical protein
VRAPESWRNKMKLKKLLTVVVVMFLSGASQHAYGQGEKIGNGGKGVLCGKKLRALDIYESEEVYQRKTSTKHITLEENLKEYGYNVYNYIYDPSRAEVPTDILPEIKTSVLDLFKDISPGEHLPFTKDATLPKMQPGCKVVQIAAYIDSDNIIKRDRVLWDQLDSQNQAALILHELVYKIDRDQLMSMFRTSPVTSDDARDLIGQIMSDQISGSRFDEFYAAKHKLLCNAGGNDASEEHSPIFSFSAVDQFQDGKRGLLLNFSALNDHYELVNKPAFIPMFYNNFLESNFEPVEIVIKGNAYRKDTHLKILPVEYKPNKHGVHYFEIKTSGALKGNSSSYGKCRLED